MTDSPKSNDWRPMPYDNLTKIEGPPERHIEQLWDEVKRLRADIDTLKEELKAKK